MFKFTNGVVVYDETTKNEYLRCGYRLVEEKNDEPIEGQITIDEVIEENLNEEDTQHESIERKPKSNRKTTK